MNNNNAKLFSVIKVALLLICTIFFGISAASLISMATYLGFDFLLHNFDGPLSAVLCIANLILTIIPFIQKQTSSRNVPIISLVLSVAVFLPCLTKIFVYDINIVLLITLILSAVVVIISILEVVCFSSDKSTKQKTTSIPNNSIEKLVGYKELLDMGIISQEEFEEKKKALLNQ